MLIDIPLFCLTINCKGVFVLSAADTTEVLAGLVEKHREAMMRKDLKWFNANPLVYCVVMHDVQEHSGLKFV